MADECDKADELIEFSMRAAVQAMRNSRGMRPTGFCHFCSEPVAGDLRFCDKDCLTDWQKEQDCKARNGSG